MNLPARNEDTDQTGGMLSLIRVFGVSICFDDMCSCIHYPDQTSKNAASYQESLQSTLVKPFQNNENVKVLYDHRSVIRMILPQAD